MKCCIKILKKNKEDKRIIGCFNLKEWFTWVDAYFSVHLNMQSHTGGAMSMGYGMFHIRSSKQKLNKKITTESDIFCTSEYVTFNLRIVMFY